MTEDRTGICTAIMAYKRKETIPILANQLGTTHPCKAVSGISTADYVTKKVLALD